MTRIIRQITPKATPLPTRVKMAAYARVSCGTDGMLHSLAAQVSHYSSLIQSRPDWEYIGVYADEALTGTKDNRPEFQRLLADCRAGRIDIVLTKSISRFARNTVTLLETVRELKALGIGVLFEEQNINTLSADGELMLSILASYAQEESYSASENCKWRIRKDFQEGKPCGYIRIFGYDFKDGKLTVVSEEAEVVRMIFADYLGGMSQSAIVKKLTRLGIPTKTGGQWNERAIGGILSNEKCIGDMRLQKSFIADHITKRQRPNKGELPQYYVEGSHEAIIGRDTFEAAQAELARRAAKVKRPSTRTVNEFSGIIRCSRCGASFRRNTNKAGTKYAKVTWACATYIRKGKDECPAKRIPEDILRTKCAEVLGLSEYDAEAFKAKVAAIHVPADGALTFILRDGTEWTISSKGGSTDG